MEEQQSRNTWINKDEPENISNLTIHKPGFEDILDDRRHTSDLKYCLKSKNPPSYKYCRKRTASDIKEHVLQSDRVNYQIEKMCREQNLSADEVKKEAEDILTEMAHDLSVPVIRNFAFFLVKVFKALFQRVYVNEEGVQMLTRLIQEYPVLIMPSHRSYLDFLLVSYIFYDFDLPLPVIASAMDFKGMKFFGWLLRKSGAFYIRRSFGTDKLYWAIFTEYVQTQLRNGDSPVEFYVEGTRSRTAKSYKPKIGMLSAALESYFKAEVPDIMMIPISISYDRIVEESLYAFELLGVPKPKESASGVFKARKILSEDYGSIHFHVGQPVSIRQASVDVIDRVSHGLEPRYINNLTRAETNLMKDLSHRIICEQQKHLVISPWSLIATILMQNKDGIELLNLVKEVEWLKRHAYNLGTYIDWPGNATTETVIQHYIKMHSNIVRINESYVEVVKPFPIEDYLKVNQLMENAAANLMLASYRNQLLHVFQRVAMISLVVNGCAADVLPIDVLFERYQFLERVLNYDFIFVPGNTKKDFDQALLVLTNSGGVSVENSHIQIKKSINKHTVFLSQMFEPFLIAYWVICQYLMSIPGDVNGRPLAKMAKDLVKDIQQAIVILIQEETISHYEILSLDILNNGILALIDLHAIYKDKRNENPYLTPNRFTLAKVLHKLADFVDLPTLSFHQIMHSGKPSLGAAKL